MLKRKPLSRRTFLEGVGAMGALIRLPLPPLVAMFNSNGTAYAGGAGPKQTSSLPTRFVYWFNGNGIPERYWIPLETGSDYALTPCLSPLARFQDDIHVVSGLDNPNARLSGVGNAHQRSMSALVSGEKFTGRGAGGHSVDQLIAGRIGRESRFRSLQIGVCQESFGHSMQRNLSWAGPNRPLPPEMIPHNLFDRLFGTRDYGWVERKHSVLDAVSGQAKRLQDLLGRHDQTRLDEYLASIRDMERAIGELPTDYANVVDEPEPGGDPKDYPRLAKLQTDLLVHAFASGQTRVASYMLSKCQSLARFPWLGLAFSRHHEYSHLGGKHAARQQEVMRDICRWHVEEFAYLVAKLKATPEGDGNLLDHSCLLFVHEHAEANDHKNSGHAAIIAGHAGGLVTGRHTPLTGTMGDLYLTLANKALGAEMKEFPTGSRFLGELVA